MTTTSSFPLATMDAPVMDDTMEMASPYQGHPDDFEIDIDLMEDQASNPDRDMTAADEYMDNAHETSYGNDGFPDEDMIDDAAEPSMIDADEYPDTNQDVPVHFEEEKTYEAEMLEDDYDEDIDAPVPDKEPEVPALSEHPEDQAILEPDTEEQGYEIGEQITAAPPPEAEIASLGQADHPKQGSERAADVPDDHRLYDSKTTHVEPSTTEQTEGTAKETDDAGQSTQELLDSDSHEQPSADRQEPENKEDQVPLVVDEPKESEAGLHDELKASEFNEQANEEHDSTNHMPLHQVKVYYQENEISLFPPREGDTSETFFLEDECLAYETFEKLFEACRDVLQSHMNENDLLVIDIESLNLQLTEDTHGTDKVTLKQIIDVYLQLCHNDGIDEPEPLYLTLSTRPTLTAELSNLLLAVNEGKGLSEIQSWDFYPEAECVSADSEQTVHEHEETYQESLEEEPQDASDNDGEDHENQTIVNICEAKATSHDQDTTNFATEVDKLAEATNDVTDLALENAASPERESAQATSPDLEEQKTDSTATIEPSPLDDFSAERLEPGEVEDHSYNNEDNEDEHLEGNQPDGETHLEEQTFAHTTEIIAAPEDLEKDDKVNITEELSEGNHDLKFENREQPTSDDALKTDVPYENVDLSTDKPDELQTHNDFEAAETLVVESSTTLQSNQNPSMVDDSLSTTEYSTKELDGHLKSATDNTIEPGEIDEYAKETVSQVENNEETELPFDEEEDYLDLGIEDDFENFDQDHVVASPSHISTKRLREFDDEDDLPETTTPEVKRSRSS
ncbi:hypothetical protein BJY04DRAFT_69169 [Aspergillus karnatakaensis]|uniref:uncharacterized protein n=1 Tax=Aspergillus karnatakaensis TaxID=1810916 RepID=UPI003CCD3B0C